MAVPSSRWTYRGRCLIRYLSHPATGIRSPGSHTILAPPITGISSLVCLLGAVNVVSWTPNAFRSSAHLAQQVVMRIFSVGVIMLMRLAAYAMTV